VAAGGSASWLLSRPRLQSSSPHRTAATKKNGEEEARDKKTAWEGVIGRSDGVRIFMKGEREICQLLGEGELE